MLALLLPILFFVSCAHHPPAKAPPVPTWINSQRQACPAGHLCAVGSSSNRETAKHLASLSIAQIFEQKLTGSFQSRLQSDNGKTWQWLSEEVKSSTALILSGIEHPESFQQQGHFYVLASLNKRRAGQAFLAHIQTLDDEMAALGLEKHTGALFVLEKKWRKRMALAKHHAFLTGLERPPPFSWEQLARRKREILKNLLIKIDIEEENPPQISALLAEILTEAGYFLAQKGPSKQATHFLRVSFKSHPLPLQVEGFRRLQFTLNLKAQNRAGTTSAQLNLKRGVSGRNHSQIKKRALSTFKEQIGKSLDKISFVP